MFLAWRCTLGIMYYLSRNYSPRPGSAHSPFQAASTPSSMSSNASVTRPCSSHRASGFQTRESPSIFQSRSLYGRDAPYLRRLTFDSDAYICVPLWLLANITHFTNNICVSLDHLEMLKAMPQLEVLCIVRMFNCRDSEDPHEDSSLPPSTKLPRLSLLSICDCIPNSFLMLSSCIYGTPALRRHFFWKYWHDCDKSSSWA